MLTDVWTYLQANEIGPNLLRSLALFLGLEILYHLLTRMKAIRISSVLAHLTIVLVSLWFFLGLCQVPPNLFAIKLLQSATLFLAILILFNILDRLVVNIYLEARRGIKVPVLLHELIRIALMVLVLFVIISKVFQAKLSTLLVSSAVVSAVIGLALQDVLGNIVAGVALHVGKPFKVGDWVKVSDQLGAVVQTSWRSTTISTLDGDFVIIPNGSIAKAEIVNYSAPDPRHAEHAQVGTRYEVPPNKVRETMIQAALQTKGVLSEPRPRVRLTQFGDFSINYDMKYWIDNFSQHDDIRDAVMASIWYHFHRRGIGIPFPIRDVNLYSVSSQEREQEETDRIAGLVRLLKVVEILSPLSDQELLQIAQGVRIHRYAAGEDIVRQGDEGDSFFIITSGLVEVSAKDQAGSQGVLARLGAGKFFGEMSLLTGERRSATVTALHDTEVGVIDKDNFARVLTTNPDIAQSLSEILERRLAEIAAKMADMEKERSARQLAVESRGNLLKRIRSFFRL